MGSIPADEIALRAVAITHVEALTRSANDVGIPWSALEHGFEFRGRTVRLATRARGIFWPQGMTVGALSIRTTIPRSGRLPRYDDQIGSQERHFEYRHQGNDDTRGRTDNQRVRECMEHRLPVLYFYAVAEALYTPLICFVSGEDTSQRSFFIEPATELQFAENMALKSAGVVRFERRYSIVEVRHRLHQSRFSAAVMSAYQTRCAICSLRHRELLDAAHIKPDCEELGEAMVPNGLALCKLHHAAFDSHIVGITPDYKVQVRSDILREHDGPLLDRGLKDFHGADLRVVPHAVEDRPERDLLAWRYERYRKGA